MLELESSSETHPFFRTRPISHVVVRVQEIGDNVKASSQLSKLKYSDARKRRNRSRAERLSSKYRAQLMTDDLLLETKLPTTLVNAEHSMDKSPKKKLLKLSANGKLLSSPSPTSVGLASAEELSPVSPRRKSNGKKGSSPKSRSASLIAKIGYGGNSHDERIRVGSTINDLISTHSVNISPNPSTPKKKRTPKKSTHPFFLRRMKTALAESDDGRPNNGRIQDTARTASPARDASKTGSPHAKKPTANRDVVLPIRNQDCRQETLPAPWPPEDMQRIDDVHYKSILPSRKMSAPFPVYKSKSRTTQLPEEEDILRHAGISYREDLKASKIYTSRHPTRKVVCGEEMFYSLERKLWMDQYHLATQRLKSILTTTLTAFDQCKWDQSSWISKSSPARAEEVLQPGQEAVMLRDWVKNLCVSSVETAQSAEKPKPTKPQPRRRGRPKLSGDIDDFIVSSEDEICELKEIDESPYRSHCFMDNTVRSVVRAGATTSSPNQNQTANTIVLSGPTGCGKTASVYAVARELGFEVFEIHPGTRRGAKEILEKVGDMTQNHLVQQQSVESSAEDAPAALIDDASVQTEIASGKQRTMNGFFQKQPDAVSKVGRKRKAAQQDDQKKESNVKKSKKTQKQSLILFEEVDVLFEDDKSFWNGVMALINQSKRPIILTCNDESTLPLDDLPLQGILRYSSPSADVATDYLLTLAASEGHELERDAVAYVYQSHRHDLRAAITELDFWCQMGIGSSKGGLDWILDRRDSSADFQSDGEKPRVFSKDTYLRGMGLVSQQPEMDAEQLVFDAHQQLDLPIDTWCAEADRTFPDSATIRSASVRADFYSDLDLCQQLPFDNDTSTSTSASDLQLRIAVSLSTRLSPNPPTTSEIIESHIQKPHQSQSQSQPNTQQNSTFTHSTFLQIFEPLTTEKPTFPASQGRLAPSLDCAPISIITTDLAPYIRSIVAFEQKWGASMPAASRRNTRASAKPESHFPAATNAELVLMTGGVGWQDLWTQPG